MGFWGLCPQSGSQVAKPPSNAPSPSGELNKFNSGGGGANRVVSV